MTSVDGGPVDGAEAGIGYTRVSDSRQVREGRSLEDQRTSLQAEAKERDIKIVEFVSDGAESGTDFDRAGIREVRYLAAQDHISYVLVDEIDRIGRDVINTLFYVKQLREKCGVTIITNEAGELDIREFQDLIIIIMQGLSSQSSVETQARRAEAGRARSFLDKNWDAGFTTVPFGYKKNEVDDWISIDQSEVEIVRNTRDNFLAADPSRPFAETIEETRFLPSDIDAEKLKRILRRPVYIGKPTTGFVDYTRNDDSKTETTLTDESLRIISDETHEKVLKKLERVREERPSSDEETDDIDSLAKEFGPVAVVECSDIIQPRCPACDGPMNRNGRDELKSRIVHYYQCTECGRQRKFPTIGELEELTEDEDNDSG